MKGGQTGTTTRTTMVTLTLSEEKVEKYRRWLTRRSVEMRFSTVCRMRLWLGKRRTAHMVCTVMSEISCHFERDDVQHQRCAFWLAEKLVPPFVCRTSKRKCSVSTGTFDITEKYQRGTTAVVRLYKDSEVGCIHQNGSLGVSPRGNARKNK